MLRLSFSELAEGKHYSENLAADRYLIGSYPRLLNALLSDSLTKKQKYYIMLYYGEGLKIPEIAKRCGVNRSTVSRTIKRGRERLKYAIGCELMKRAASKPPKNDD